MVPLVAFVVRLAGTAPGQLSSPGAGAALVVSLETASVATAVIAITCVPFAYLLARGHRRASMLLGIAVQLPIALPPLMSGILLLYLVGPYSALGALFSGGLTDDFTGIVLAQIVVAAPFCIVAARSAFAALDPALDDVAATLGHGRLARFSRVALPAAAQGIGAGLLLAWLRAFGEFGATVVLAYHPYSLPVFTYVQFGSIGLAATMLPVAEGLVAAAAVLGLATMVPRVRPARRPPERLPAATAPTIRHGASLAFDLSARLGSFQLEIAHRNNGRCLGILGASGAGKTLTLRLLAGLVVGDHGRIHLGGADLSNVPPESRGVGYVPQDTNLLPHLPVWGQTTFGVGADPGLAAYWIARLHLEGLIGRRPDELSGGQRRRVGLARALARDPPLLLLDEPLSGLDTPARAELRSELRRLQLDTGVTTVVVTHDVEDAAMLADEVLILDNGRLIQSGSLADLLARPANSQVARLLGLTNICTGSVIANGRLRVGSMELEADTVGHPPGARIGWRIRPDCVQIDARSGHSATIIDVTPRDGYRQVQIALDDGPFLIAHTRTAASAQAGQRCSVHMPPTDITVWPFEDSRPARTP